LAVLCGCGREVPVDAPSGDATATTAAANRAYGDSLSLDDPRDAADASRGFIARPQGKVLAADGTTIWDYGRFGFIQGEAPASVNPSLWRHAMLNNNAGLYQVSDGIYQLRGFDLANMTLIQGKTGWIVVDPLTSRETSAAALAFARQHLGDRPVSAIIFTHSHIDHFGGALGVVSEDEVARRRLPVIAPEGFLEEATSENILLGPAMGRRSVYQFGNSLPATATGLVGAGLGQGVARGTIGILPPNLVVNHTPQAETVDGVRFVFQNAPGSEAPAELAFYLPDLKAYCGAEIMVPTLHNLYTLRGAKVRDALRWSGYIDEAMVRFGDAEILFTSHLWPTWGRDNIAHYMAQQRDAYKYIHDQTVRMINAGMKPDEIAEQISFPVSLREGFSVHGYYGSLKHDARAVYQFYMGWFDGNPANLDPLPRAEAARRYVELMGGSDKVVSAAQSAFDQGDYRWVAELLNHVVFADPGNKSARELLASAHDQMGYVAESAIWRNFYLTGARELRGATTGASPKPSSALAMLEWAPVDSFLEAWAAALDGPGAEGKHLKINLTFTDLAVSSGDNGELPEGNNYVLWIENSVLHFRHEPPAEDANAGIALPKALFLKVLVGESGITDLLGNDDLVLTGSKLDLIGFFRLLEKPPASFPIVTP